LWHIVAKAQVRSSFFARAGIFGCTLAISLCAGCGRRPPTVAVIPRTTALILWEAAHAGAETAARQEGLKVYWNAPTREDDVQRQIDIMQHAISSGARGLVLAPDQGLALMVPVRNIVARGIPTVIISSRLPVQPGGKLSYILNDEETTGRMAAQRIGQILSGKGTVAVLGVDPDVSGILERTHAFEASLASLYPGVRIVEERAAGFNIAEAQDIAEDVLERNPHLDVFLALNSATTRGAYLALKRRGLLKKVKLVACEQELVPPLLTGEIDAIVVENTYEMGRLAVQAVAREMRGEPVPALIKLSPKLVTRENFYSPEVRRMLSMDWKGDGRSGQ
jgi:ribose transport system substrate-binding protein